MNNKTLVYCPSCGGEGRVMDIKLYPNGPSEVYEECKDCDGNGDMYYEEFIDKGFHENELKVVETPIVENFEIY